MFIIDCLDDIKKVEKIVPFEVYNIIKERETERIKNLVGYIRSMHQYCRMWDAPDEQFNINTFKYSLIQEDPDCVAILNGDETDSELISIGLNKGYTNLCVPEDVEYIKCENGEEYTTAMILYNNDSALTLYIKGHIEFKYY